MKTINIFIACSLQSEILTDQKMHLARKCRELNTELAEIGKDFYINPIMYENPERRMEVFKKHIKHDDIVIFMIDNERDAVLVDELVQAVNLNIVLNKPEVLVFASDKIKNNKEYDNEIKQICADGGWLYEPLKNTEDLWDNVKEKIYRYVRSYKKIKKLRSLSSARYYGLRHLLPFMFVLLGISLVLGYRYYKSAETKRLLIVGGGSARNYIEDSSLKQKHGNNTDLVKLNPDFWWYAPMPSGDSYRMIAEEIINLESDYKSRPYYPIIISAEQAKEDTLFRRTIDTSYFREKGYVIGIHIGDDYLVAYGDNGAFDEYKNLINSNGTIYEEYLDLIINDQAQRLKNNDTTSLIKIFTTNKNSGTLNAYLDTLRFKHTGLNNYMEVRDSKQLKQIFSSIDSLNINKKWLVLGSRYYKTKNVDAIPLTVLDTKYDMIHDTIIHDTIKKPIYVYFLLYKDNDSYRLPDATEDFLRTILKENDADIIDRIKLIKCNDTTIIKKNTILYEFE